MQDNRLVLDTNVFVSAGLFDNSKPARVLREILNTGTLLISLKTLEKLKNVLSRQKFDRYISSEDKKDFLAVLVSRSILIEPTSKISVCRDPKDNQILELAVSGEANFVVKGDDRSVSPKPFPRHSNRNSRFLVD